MSTSLKIVNGDLSVGSGRSFEVVSGRAKLQQDLKLWVLERIGSDPATPTYGSRLDGGIINGVEVPTFIGTIINDQVAAEIRSEIITLIQRYQQGQFEKVRNETILYTGKNTLDKDELIKTLDSVRVRAEGTTIIVSVTITTMADNTVSLTLPLTEQGLA